MSNVSAGISPSFRLDRSRAPFERASRETEEEEAEGRAEEGREDLSGCTSGRRVLDNFISKRKT